MSDNTRPKLNGIELGPGSPLLTAAGVKRVLAPKEKDTQQAVKRLYALVGCVVYDLSQPRATMQTPGLPDLYVVWPTRQAAWWHEVKRPGGKLSPAQKEFQQQCLLVGAHYVFGGVEAAEAALAHARSR